MSVSAIIVTRGDVSLQEAMSTIPDEWEKLVWCNGHGLYRWGPDIAGNKATFGPYISHRVDLSVYGRYHAIQHAQHDLIYVQDDDCVVSDPDAIVRAYYEDMLVCNMPQEFRHDFYTDHALVGFGAAFHRDAPRRAFDRYFAYARAASKAGKEDIPFEGGTTFDKTCDIIFTGLSDRVLVDVPKENLPWAYGDDRMWKQPEHLGIRAQMHELMLAARKENP